MKVKEEQRHESYFFRRRRSIEFTSRRFDFIMGNKCLDCTALTLTIIGAINWGLIGFFRFDLVAFLFGDMSWLSRVVYALVGLCGLYMLAFYRHCGRDI